MTEGVGATGPADVRDDDEEAADTQLSHAFHRSLIAGEERLARSWPSLLATGFLGGMDVGVGLLALLVVLHATGDHLLASLAFGSGFVTLTLARSELFTENFLVPVTVVVIRRRGQLRPLFRLWVGTLVTNWVGGAVFVGLILLAVPTLGDAGIEVGRVYPELGFGARAFASAMLGGILITLMTWIQRANPEPGPRLVVAVMTGFLLAAPPLAHSVVGVLEMLAGLFTGRSPYGWGRAAGVAGWSVAGNMLGGLGLVTMVRLVQIGSETITEERRALEHDEPAGRI